jgi:uncharacterized protein (DUF58 family)
MLSINKMRTPAKVSFHLAVMGFVIVAMIAIILFLSLSSATNRNFSLFFAFSLFSVVMVSLRFTHNNIKGLVFSEGKRLKGGADSTLRFQLRVENPTRHFKSTLTLNLNGKSIKNFEMLPFSKKILKIECEGSGRGTYSLSHLRVSSDYPIGFINITAPVEICLQYLCFPLHNELYEKCSSALKLNNVIDERLNISGLTNYRQGDSIARVHWRHFAKTNRLVVKEFERSELSDQQGDSAMYLDFSQEQGEFETRIAILANKLAGAINQNLTFSLAMPKHHVPLGIGNAHFERCLFLLANYECSSEVAMPCLKRGNELLNSSYQ